MVRPELVLFDIGGVLIEYEDVFKSVDFIQGVKSEYLDKTFDRFDREITTGKMTPTELYLKTIQDYGLDADPDYDFLQGWINDFHIIRSGFDLLNQISSKYKVGLLSNIYKGMVERMIDQGILPDIEYAYKFLSCEIAMQKPDNEIYKEVTKVTGTSLEKILFIDDREEYLVPAKNLGWQTYLFERFEPERSVEQLKKFLL